MIMQLEAFLSETRTWFIGNYPTHTDMLEQSKPVMMFLFFYKGHVYVLPDLVSGC